MLSLSDNFGRRFSYLRVSVTSVCNFRCIYCLPDGFRKDPNCDPPLTQDEFKLALSAFAELGVKKIRFSGGEPTVRKDLTSIIKFTSNINGIKKIGITTNGFKLPKLLPELVDAGITNLNVSIDSLNPLKFHKITGQNKLGEVLNGAKEALRISGLSVKINTVLLKGINDDEILDFIELVREQSLQVRFIELMETADMLSDRRQGFFKKHYLPASSIENMLIKNGWLKSDREPHAGPAKIYRHPDYRGEVGLIAPYAKDFCMSCNRLRLSSTGDLHLCLFPSKAYPLRHFLKDERHKEELKSFVIKTVLKKDRSHRLHDRDPGIISKLAVIGG